MKLRPAVVLLLFSIASLGQASTALSDGSFTMPIWDFPISAWVDHTSPGGFGLVDQSSTMTRYDQQTGYAYNGHSGTDFDTLGVEGYEVLAADAGEVVAAGWANDGFGYRVRLWHGDIGASTLYAHLRVQPLVAIGQQVARKYPLGESGNTGSSTGPHLHFGAYNSRTGWTPVDPYGWSGTGNDPWPPGQAFGHLWAIRLGVKGGAGVWAAEGTLTAPGQQEDATATSFAMAGARIGTIRGGNAWAKDGQLGAGWWGGQPIYAGATAIALSGRRVGIITSSGVAKAKDGDLSAAWYTIRSGVSQITVFHDPTGATPSRVGVLAGGKFYIQEGSLANPLWEVAVNATAIALGGGWMGYIHQNGNAFTKVGLNDPWTPQVEDGGVTFMSLGGSGSDRRIGLIKNNIAIARVGEDPWVAPLYTGATKIRVNSGRVAVLTNAGQMKAKEGSLYEEWTPLSSNVTDIQLN